MPADDSSDLGGVVVFDRDAPAPTTGVVHVSVLDVSDVDAASVTVGQAHVDVTDDAAPSRELGFTVHDVALADGRDYIVRAHWDRSGNGAVETGDQITTVSVPIRHDLRVPLKVIR